MKTIEIRYFIPYPATLDEGKAMYRKLAAMNHPDHGGDAEVMKAINTEWEYLKTRLPRFNPTGKAHDFGADHARESEKAQKQAAVDAELHPIGYELDRAGIQDDGVGKWIWPEDRPYEQFYFESRPVPGSAGDSLLELTVAEDRIIAAQWVAAYRQE